MSGKYDIESFVNEIIAILKADLPSKIAAINAEKADSFTIDSIPDANYVDDIGDQVLNMNNFIYYTIVDIDTNTVGASTGLNITMAVSVVFNNTNKSGTINRVFRYSRCLREVIQSKFKNTAKASRYKITEFVPVDIQLNQGSEFKMGGIHINASIVG